VERQALRVQLPTWAPVPLQRLPFRSVLVASRNDPFCTYERACAFAQAWGSQCIDLGHCGHINTDSGLASWPEGHLLLQDLLND
jgi:predicted alpha/beta hydrolase family esterase